LSVQFWIFAGPNGAGKSTLVARYVRGRIPVVNPDDVARVLPPRGGQPDVLEAGRIALAQREAHLAAGQSFGVETTLTGHSEINLMRRARAAGCKVNLVFVGLDDVQLSASRVQARVRDGGHNVPLADVFRRFDRSIANLSIALMIADRSYVFDNSGERRRLLLLCENGKLKRLAKVIPRWAAVAIPAELRDDFGPLPDAEN
jgi:predicted ABC-type ATPase